VIRISLLAVIVIAITTGRALAQEQTTPALADVARQAEAAKPTVKKAKKTYTNSDLRADPRGEATPAPASASAPTIGKLLDQPAAPQLTATSPGAKADADAVPQESEDSWRTRATYLREQVAQLRGRLTELTTPNQLTDANPILQAAVAGDIKNTRDALARLRAQWSRLEASAREKQISLAWIEPAPQFPE
jgi:hypothetical protein